MYKSMGPNCMLPRVLKELAYVVVKPLSIILYQVEFLVTIKREISLFFKKNRKEDLENYRRGSLTSFPGKIMEQILLAAKHMQDKEMIHDSQHSFTKGRSCLTNALAALATVYDGATASVDRGRGTEIIYLNFCIAFNVIPCHIFISKLE